MSTTEPQFNDPPRPFGQYPLPVCGTLASCASNGDIIVLFSISPHLFCYLLRVCNSVFMRL